MLPGMRSQVGKRSVRDQVLFFGNGNLEIPGKRYIPAFREAFTGPAENTASHVDHMLFCCDGILGAGVGTGLSQVSRGVFMNLRTPAVALPQFDFFPGVLGGSVALFKSIFQRIQHRYFL